MKPYNDTPQFYVSMSQGDHFFQLYLLTPTQRPATHPNYYYLLDILHKSQCFDYLIDNPKQESAISIVEIEGEDSTIDDIRKLIFNGKLIA